MKDHFDIAIIGSGFSGSILARILASRGRSVLLVDASRHPRFAIGESSTPIADLILRQLGTHYGMQDLIDLSSYGQWRQKQPDVSCGMKRGFSYFDHRHEGREQSVGQHSLIVAASPTDDKSDTHWYRSEVDAFLFQKAIQHGVAACEGNAVTELKRSDAGRMRITLADGQTPTADFVVDASGSATVSAKHLGASSLRRQLRTRTCSAFAHFRGVKSFSDRFNEDHGDHRGSEPFDADAAAQHHLIDEGWVWLLRFDNGVTSVGLTSPLAAGDHPQTTLEQSIALINNRFASYPQLQRILIDSVRVAPGSGLVTLPHIQRLYDPIIADNCVLMPTTAVNIDPLHSTGIAHALSGVARISQLLLDGAGRSGLASYREAVLAEADLIDRLVSMAYQSMHSFRRFTASCMVYFATAIACEERLGRGQWPTKLWQADDATMMAAIKRCQSVLNSSASDEEAVASVDEILSPWNTAGLFHRQDNRYAYTATK